MRSGKKHRAKRALDALVGVLRAAELVDDVAAGRQRRLSPEHGDVINVLPGSLTRHDVEGNTLTQSDIVVAILIEIQRPDDETLLEDLYSLLVDVVAAINADETLGLPFVIAAEELGAPDPELGDAGERVSGVLQSRWRLLFQHNRLDPSQ